MRIVILRTGTSDFGKIGSYNVQEVGLATALIKKGHDVSVLYLNEPVNDIEKDEVYDFVYYLPHKSIGLHGIFDVNVLTKFNPEKVILFSDNQLWAKNVILWCKKNNVKCIHYFGNVLSDNKKWLNQFYTKLILKRNIRSYNYSVNVAKTEKVHQEMNRLKVPFAKVIPVGLDETLLQDCQNLDLKVKAELGFEKNEIVILFIGRLIDYKKPLLACDILKSLIDKGIDARMVIIGKGVLQEDLLKYIDKQSLSANIRYIEKVPYKEIYRYMVSSDCLINLSSQEIFGMTILEAMYYGLPVVAHTAPGPNEIIEFGENGFLCDSDDVEVWKSLIIKAIESRSDIGRQAKQLVLDKFVWDKIADEFLRLL